MIHLRIVAPERCAHQALELLERSDSVINVIHLHGAARKPVVFPNAPYAVDLRLTPRMTGVASVRWWVEADHCALEIEYVDTRSAAAPLRQTLAPKVCSKRRASAISRSSSGWPVTWRTRALDSCSHL